LYLIRLASGEERSFPTIEELAAAVQRGEVTGDATIYHRRSKQWLPLEHHPYFAFATGELQSVSLPEPEAPAPFSPEPPTPPQPAGSLLAEEDRLTATPSNLTPMRPESAPPLPPRPSPPVPREPIAPTPLRIPKPPRPEPERPAMRDSPPEERAPAEPLAVRPPRGRRTGMWITIIVVLGTAVGIMVGIKLRAGSRDAMGADGPSFRPAPAPSSLLADSARPVDSGPAPPKPPASRVDPTAPATPDQLMARREEAFRDARLQLGRDLAALDFNSIFGVRALSTPDGARAARRVVASALNVMGQFHRREVMTDRAYDDTAAFQATRAGWSRPQSADWEGRPTLKEPYQSADLAESLLADADSLLSILGSNTQWTVEGDSLRFEDAVRANAYQAQRARIFQRAGAAVPDTDARPTLAYVRGAVNPAVIPSATR